MAGRGLTGGRYLNNVDRLEAAILKEWERRWPDQKWREMTTGVKPDGSEQTRKGPYRQEVRDKARAAAEATLDAMANR